MKTLITIAGTTLSLPKTSTINLAQLLELLHGAAATNNKIIYGPEGDERYNDKYYRNVEVVSDRPLKIRIEQVHDDEVLTGAEFEKLQKEIARQIEKDFPKKDLPEAETVAFSA